MWLVCMAIIVAAWTLTLVPAHRKTGQMYRYDAAPAAAARRHGRRKRPGQGYVSDSRAQGYVLLALTLIFE